MADSQKNVLWNVSLSTKTGKQARKLPKNVLDSLVKLIKNMELGGPIQKSFPNFSSLDKSKLIPKDSYHCHIKKGRPTYVACWQEVSEKTKRIEVFYVGTHEGAPY